MRPGLRRQLAGQCCRVLHTLLPADMKHWSLAIYQEVEDIPDDAEALFFALGGFIGILSKAILNLLIPHPSLSTQTKGMHHMAFEFDRISRPSLVGMASASAAVFLGIAYMAMAGAPIRYLGINAAALLLGLCLVLFLGRMIAQRQHVSSVMTFGFAVMLLITALFGNAVEGAMRWINVGPLAVQTSLILLPAMIMQFATSRDRLATVGMVIAAIALALQPDRAMAGMLAASLTFLAVFRPEQNEITGAATGNIAFLATLLQADALPAMPYVDQILYSAFDVHMLAGLAVLGGSALLFVPAVFGSAFDPEKRHTYGLFAIIWASAVLAAALDNYPTPIVGYGGSAILGYLLSLIHLPLPLAVAEDPMSADRKETSFSHQGFEMGSLQQA